MSTDPTTAQDTWRHCSGMTGNQITRGYDERESPRIGGQERTCDNNNNSY